MNLKGNELLLYCSIKEMPLWRRKGHEVHGTPSYVSVSGVMIPMFCLNK